MHNKENKSPNIILRVFFYTKDNNYYAICLDTDIVVRGDTLQECSNKMVDATKSYMKSFSKEEIEKEEYIRLAPLKYFVKGFSLILGIFFRHMFGSLYSGEYDTINNNFKLA